MRACLVQGGNDSDSEVSGCTTCRDSGMDPSEDSDHVPCVRQSTWTDNMLNPNSTLLHSHVLCSTVFVKF